MHAKIKRAWILFLSEKNQQTNRSQKKNIESLELLFSFSVGYAFVIICQYKKICDEENIKYQIIPALVIFSISLLFYLYKMAKKFLLSRRKIKKENNKTRAILKFVVFILVYFPILILLESTYFGSWSILFLTLLSWIIIFLVGIFTGERSGLSDLIGKHKYQSIITMPAAGFTVAFCIHVTFGNLDFKTHICDEKPKIEKCCIKE